jgi:hypothetical protein
MHIEMLRFVHPYEEVGRLKMHIEMSRFVHPSVKLEK